MICGDVQPVNQFAGTKVNPNESGKVCQRFKSNLTV